MLKAKTAATTPQAYSKETDEMKMRNHLKRLGQLNAEISEQAVTLEQKALSDAFSDVKAAWRKFQAHCDITDSARTGKEPTEDETAAYNRAEKVYDDALRAFFGYPFQTMEGHQVKAQMILENDFLRGEFDNYLDEHLRGLAGVGTPPNVFSRPEAGIEQLIARHAEAAKALEKVPGEVDFNDGCPEWLAENAALDALLSYAPKTVSEFQKLIAHIKTAGDTLERVAPNEMRDLPDSWAAKLFKMTISLDQLPSDGRSRGETSAHPVIGNEPEEPLLVLIAEAFSQAEHNDAHRARAEGKDDVTKSIYFESGAKHENDRVMVLRDALSGIEARSAFVAMAQLAEAITKIDLIESSSEDFPEHHKREMDRLLFSALRYVERLTGKTLEDIGLASMRYRNLDTWETVEARLNLIAENANG